MDHGTWKRRADVAAASGQSVTDDSFREKQRSGLRSQKERRAG